MIGAAAGKANDAMPLVTRPVAWFLICSVTTLASFFLLLSVVPLYASGGREGGVAAGLTTGVMMLATVLTELIAPGLLTRLGYRSVIAAGIILLGAPTLLLPFSSALPLVLGVCAARGAGLAVTVVAGTALAAELSPAGRRGEMLGVYGVAVSVPSIVGLPLGVWLSDRIGFTAVFLLAAAITPISLAIVPLLPALRPEVSESSNVLSALRWRPVARLALIFTMTTVAAGVFFTFLPIAVSDDALGIVAIALFAQSVATSSARWGAGRLGDRYGPSAILAPSLLLATIGAACLIAIDSPVALVFGMSLFGIGFGGIQNLTLTLMFDRVPPGNFSRVSALWNLAFDGGMGIGAVGFGYLTIATGYPWGFASIAILLSAASALALFDRRTVSPIIP